jgi:energy-coupling factor transport system substrate-specific component
MDIATLCYWGLLIILIIGLFYSVFKLFEKSKPTVENIVIIALLIAIAIIGTLPTAAVPGLQIASFIIIMTGIVFGRQTGFITGVLTPVVIGLFSGLGFWTLFQMLGFGLMGLTAGILAPKLENNTYLRAAFGFMWGLLYGWITNISMFPFLQEINMGTIIGVYASSLVFDLMHGIVTAILLVALFGTFKRIFSRAKENYFN